jgi:hypothetical protein
VPKSCSFCSQRSYFKICFRSLPFGERFSSSYFNVYGVSSKEPTLMSSKRSLCIFWPRTAQVCLAGRCLFCSFPVPLSNFDSNEGKIFCVVSVFTRMFFGRNLVRGHKFQHSLNKKVHVKIMNGNANQRWKLSCLWLRAFPTAGSRIWIPEHETSSVTCLYMEVYISHPSFINETKKRKLRGLSPRANYTDRGAAACRRS